jgi:hypothetical protein
MDDIMNKNGIISDSQQKLNQENINLNKNEEVLRKLLEKFYADQKNIQDTAIQNLNIQKVAIP